MNSALPIAAVAAAIYLLSSCGDSASEKVVEPRKPDVIDDAYKVCTAMEATGLTTKCTVGGWHQTIDATIDTTGAEARKICAGVVSLLMDKTPRFKGEWKLRILSPYSGESPIAVCTLG